jgi:glycosyl hydrolase family 42 (putative beta-galactosidase)
MAKTIHLRQTRLQSTVSRGWKLILGGLLVVSQSASAGEQMNGFPGGADFFPIGVWLQSPANAARYKAIGINTFVGLHQGPTEQQLAVLARVDMFAVAEQNDVGLNSPNRHIIKAWIQGDEPDNAQPVGVGLYGTCIPASEVARRTRELKGRDPTRPVMINFGQGVANEFWKGRGSCNGDQGYYDVAIKGADIVSYDIYPVGSATPQVKGRLEYVARGVTNLVRRVAPGQTVWMALETTALNPARRPTPAEVRAEVWMALIHGATGIFYFVHEFTPTFREDAIFRYPDVVEEVTSTNQLIKSLSPVFKTPSLSGIVSVSSQVPIAIMVKAYQGTLYIFAVAMQNSPSTVRVTVDGDHHTSARVIGESRSLPITQRTFEDRFEGYGVHLYQIP